MYITQFYMTINVVYNIKLSTESDLKKTQNCILKKMIERRSYGCLQVAVLVTKTPSLSDVIKLHMQLFNFTHLDIISFPNLKEQENRS